VQYSRFGFVEKTNGNKLKTNFEIIALRIENRILIRAINPSSRRDGGHASRRTENTGKADQQGRGQGCLAPILLGGTQAGFEAVEGSGSGGSESLAST
ncbi:MAG: hypothetical protein VX034_02715, partial [Planctomycetota bacterium]|nr:hypothetical protein [Planctomycetota bacterium]